MAKWQKLARPGLLGAVLALTLGGCSSSDQMKKQVSGLEKQIVAMRADSDRMEERLAQLELANRRSESARKDAPAPTGSSDRLERPRLKVIHVTPDAPGDEPETTPAAPTDSATKRPVIRGTGERVIKMFDAESAAKAGSKPIAAAGPTSGG